VSLFLTPDELHELTGLRVPAYQCRWLEKHAYPFEITASGKPKVLRAFLMQKLGMVQQSTAGLAAEPNFDAIV
jgi:hypothetical protein